MNGDTKGAFLSDTDDTDVTGGELVTNGTFDTDLTGWTASTAFPPASFVWSNGAMVLTGSGGTYSSVNHPVSCVVGKHYVVSADITGAGYISSSNSQGGWSPTSGITSFVATSPTMFIVAATGGSSVVTFDNISVKLADTDRSVNANALLVNGTITKTPVATGAELVGYSGFSGSNYLEQPYNSDLDFGTGDFCIMGWATASSASDWMMVRQTAGTTNTSGFWLYQTGGSYISGDLAYRSFEGGSSTQVTVGTLTTTFKHFAVVRRSGVASTYMNGVFQNSVADTRNVSSTDAELFIGCMANQNNPWTNGKAALIRISATAPTAAQIAKIYNDEKVLFQENAACTLYGTSDAVTALAHDSTTDLLHVGTSAGRSVFQGLRRVSNTTTAVGTAISASDGLVVEE